MSAAPLKLLTLVATLVLGCGSDVRSPETEFGGSVDAPPDASWQATIAPPSESGERLVISGAVYEEDGMSPAKDVILYAYHTNAEGIYPKTRPDDGTLRWRHGALRGFMKTDARGHYELRTIRPAPYPGGNTAAHIHCTITAPGIPEYWIEDFLFEDDPLVTERDRRGHGRSVFPHVVNVIRGEDGVWRGTRDIQIVRGLE